MKALREKDIPDASMYPGKVKRLALAMIKRGCSREDAFGFIASAKGISERDKPAVAAWFAERLPKLPENVGGKALHEDCACCLGGKLADKLWQRGLPVSGLCRKRKGEMI